MSLQGRAGEAEKEGKVLQAAKALYKKALRSCSKC